MAKKDTKTRQAEIAGMAIDIIGEMGVSGLTTARLAERLSMSEPNLYRHFRDKEAILSAVIDELGALLMDSAGRIAGEDLPPDEKLRLIMENHMEVVEKRAGLPRLVFSEDMHVRYPALRDKLTGRIGGYLLTIEKVIGEGIEDGTFRMETSPKETARTYLGMVQFAAMRWSLCGFSFSLKDEGGRLWANFHRMIRDERKA
ncbi:MAG: TetR/AcrR family transcriptional regulator [Nitrospirae bacterium]|nr:TetR/AcrR family transcriptional regulator [Nitrospirota bacterium]